MDEVKDGVNAPTAAPPKPPQTDHLAAEVAEVVDTAVTSVNLMIAPGPENVRSNYLLMGAGFLTMGLSGLIGWFFAHTNRGRADPISNRHYLFQCRTFFGGLIGMLVPIPLIALLATIAHWPTSWALFGLAGFPLTALWFGARAIQGFIKTLRDEPINDPESWSPFLS